MVLLPAKGGTLPRQRSQRSSQLSGRGNQHTCMCSEEERIVHRHTLLPRCPQTHLLCHLYTLEPYCVHSERMSVILDIIFDSLPLPSSHPSHRDLGGHGVLLGYRAGVVPEHHAPPLVPPGIFCQVHDHVHLLFALRVVLSCKTCNITPSTYFVPRK